MSKKKFWENKKILVTGGKGFVGSHVVDHLVSQCGVAPENIRIPSAKKDDLRVYENVQRVMKNIDVVLHLAADVGGIAYSSSHPATQFRNCILIDSNMFEAASLAKVKKFVCVSSAVAYPVDAKSPLREKDLFKGMPAKGGYGYGFAKRMSVVMARAYAEEKSLNTSVLLSSNSYGPGDDFDLEAGHVIPSLIRKCLTQKELVVWGDGSQIRDFFYVKDFARAVVLAAEKVNSDEPINIGSGKGYSIKQVVKTIVKTTAFKGKVTYDTTKPTGQKRRVVSIEKVNKLLQFQPKYSLEEGIQETVTWYSSKNH